MFSVHYNYIYAHSHFDFPDSFFSPSLCNGQHKHNMHARFLTLKIFRVKYNTLMEVVSWCCSCDDFIGATTQESARAHARPATRYFHFCVLCCCSTTVPTMHFFKKSMRSNLTTTFFFFRKTREKKMHHSILQQ